MIRKLLCWLGFHELERVIEEVDFGELGKHSVYRINCKHCGRLRND